MQRVKLILYLCIVIFKNYEGSELLSAQLKKHIKKGMAYSTTTPYDNC
jgi:hypothetical protein